MRIAVIGATGVVGRHVVPRLREHGHQVRAVVRAETDAGALRRLGIDAVQGDMTQSRPDAATSRSMSIADAVAWRAGSSGAVSSIRSNIPLTRKAMLCCT